MSIEHSPDRGEPKYLTRRKLAQFLNERGYPIALSTLQKLMLLKQGPTPAGLWGQYPVYRHRSPEVGGGAPGPIR